MALLVLRARRRRRYGLQGRVVFITGGARGLGYLLALAFARKGAKVAICARDGADLERAVDALQREGARVLALTCDVTNREDVTWALKRAKERLGSLDVVVNNAGLTQVGTFESLSEGEFRGSMDVHFWGPLHLIREALPELRRRGGRIVNITSIGGRVSVPHMLSYDASKAALSALSRGLAAELGRDGVYVTTVVPGLMRTGSPPQASFKGHAWFAASGTPRLAMDAWRAARRIVSAVERAEREVVLGAPARVFLRYHDSHPNLAYEALSAVESVLPVPGDGELEAGRGLEGETPMARKAETEGRNTNEPSAWP